LLNFLLKQKIYNHLTQLYETKMGDLLFVCTVNPYLSYHLELQNRVYDWDMPGYLGCMYTSEFPDSPDKVRIITYEEIKRGSCRTLCRRYRRKAVGYTKAVFHQKYPVFYRTVTLFSDQSRVYSCYYPFYKLGVSPPMSVLGSVLFLTLFQGYCFFTS
jgi:hypothetical protein